MVIVHLLYLRVSPLRMIFQIMNPWVSFFPDQLATWVDQLQVKQNAVDSLSTILTQCGHPDLAATARSLLKTSRVVNIEKNIWHELFLFSI